MFSLNGYKRLLNVIIIYVKNAELLIIVKTLSLFFLNSYKHLSNIVIIYIKMYNRFYKHDCC
jgi:hypothetical protein